MLTPLFISHLDSRAPYVSSRLLPDQLSFRLPLRPIVDSGRRPGGCCSIASIIAVDRSWFRGDDMPDGLLMVPW